MSAARIAALEDALWGFAYAVEPGESFCAGCDLDGPRALAPEERHDPECRAARALLGPRPAPTAETPGPPDPRADRWTLDDVRAWAAWAGLHHQAGCQCHGCARARRWLVRLERRRARP